MKKTLEEEKRMFEEYKNKFKLELQMERYVSKRKKTCSFLLT